MTTAEMTEVETEALYWIEVMAEIWQSIDDDAKFNYWNDVHGKLQELDNNEEFPSLEGLVRLVGQILES